MAEPRRHDITPQNPTSIDVNRATRAHRRHTHSRLLTICNLQHQHLQRFWCHHINKWEWWRSNNNNIIIININNIIHILHINIINTNIIFFKSKFKFKFTFITKFFITTFLFIFFFRNSILFISIITFNFTSHFTFNITISRIIIYTITKLLIFSVQQQQKRTRQCGQRNCTAE